MNIIYLQGDATKPVSDGEIIIAHICNDMGAWGRGFVMALSERWPEPRRAYRKWYEDRANGDDWRGFGLGVVQFVRVEPFITVANMIGQHRVRSKSNVRPIRYSAVEKCLNQVASYAITLDAEVHMPRIGCGLAGGEWSRIEPIIDTQLCQCGIQVFVYDLEQNKHPVIERLAANGQIKGLSPAGGCQE